MRLLTVVLAGLILWIQAELWFGKAGMPTLLERRSEYKQLVAANAVAKDRNDRLQAEVSDLKEGLEMVEEKARSELGMIKPDELLVVVTRPAAAAPAPSPAASR
jgi:cell division protein FtsB